MHKLTPTFYTLIVVLLPDIEFMEVFQVDNFKRYRDSAF
jgi:hypothetical protein